MKAGEFLFVSNDKFVRRTHWLDDAINPIYEVTVAPR